MSRAYIGEVDYEAATILQHNRNMYNSAWMVWSDLSDGEKTDRIKRTRVDIDAVLAGMEQVEVTEDTKRVWYDGDVEDEHDEFGKKRRWVSDWRADDE